MIRVESGCVDCGLPCMNRACRYYKHIIYECDACGEEGPIYWFDNDQLCINCVEERLEEVIYDE